MVNLGSQPQTNAILASVQRIGAYLAFLGGSGLVILVIVYVTPFPWKRRV